MKDSGGRFAEFISGEPGYFRHRCESDFPWHVNDRFVWYALFVIEDGKIIRYGFTSSKANKQGLCAALEKLDSADEALLLGIWTGQYSTHLFVLDPDEALAYLNGPKRWNRFKHLRNAQNVKKVFGPRGGFKCISYEYVDDSGVRIHRSLGIRDEAEELEAYFRSVGIDVLDAK